MREFVYRRGRAKTLFKFATVFFSISPTPPKKSELHPVTFHERKFPSKAFVSLFCVNEKQSAANIIMQYVVIFQKTKFIYVLYSQECSL